MSEPVKAVNKWLVTIAVMLPTIMEIVDTSVANVALPHMQGSLMAGTDEVTWVLTSYLVSNAVVLPMTGWLSRIFGRKRFLITCITLFTFASFLCGAAPNLATLIFFRVLQGAAGGALIPSSQAILLETFPPHERGMANAIFGVGAMFGPIIGPALGDGSPTTSTGAGSSTSTSPSASSPSLWRPTSSSTPPTWGAPGWPSTGGGWGFSP